mmetsp:Transcript_140959/g.351477  ORF Transcript_140959/g.351477 Transcript_140959/m.351477 type:complete len:301 (-) Transcript_140959:272-1174(-)
MTCSLKVALFASALGHAASTCPPEDERCQAGYDADQDSLIQVRERRSHSARAFSDAPYPSGCADTYNQDYGVYNEPACSSGSLSGCKADALNQDCRYCGPPASGHGQVYEDCPPDPDFCPTPPSNCAGHNTYYCVYTDPSCSEYSQPGCLGFNDCRYCGREYGPCPDSPPVEPETSTTATTTSMTYQDCILGISVFEPPDPSTGMPGDSLAGYGVPSWKCTQVDPEDDTVFFTSSWSHPHWSPQCYGQTLGTVSWYHTSDCTGEWFTSMTVFTDGDTNRYGCKDAKGKTLDPANCRGSWR